MEDHSNRTRLAKLLRFRSSNDKEKLTSLADYVSRMKDKQEHLYFMAGSSLEEVQNSPFVERLLKKGLYIQSGEIILFRCSSPPYKDVKDPTIKLLS